MEQIIFLLILAALAVGKHFLENAGGLGGDNTPDEPSRPVPRQRPAPLRPATGKPGEETEEERMRRFMEALGLPPTAPPPSQPKPAAATPKPPERKAPLPPPKPSVRNLGEPFGGPRQPPVLRRRKPALAPDMEPIAPTAARPLSESAPSMTMVRTAPAAAPVQVAPPSLLGIPDDPTRGVAPAAGMGVAPLTQLDPGTAGRVSMDALGSPALRQLLRDPASLRNAILMREILGAPKGLQSSPGPSIFQLP